MTTIVFKDGVLAADTRATRSGKIVPSQVDKLFRMPDGSVVSGTGATAQIQAFIAWLKGGKFGDAPDMDNATVIHLQIDGVVVEYDCSSPVICAQSGFESWGTGATVALGAYLMNPKATAEELVEVGCKGDSGSGLPVRTMKLEPTREHQLATQEKARAELVVDWSKVRI